MNAPRLLVVEDNPSDLELITQKLNVQCPEEFEYRMIDSLDGALKLMQEQKFDVVLLDLTLPTLDWPQIFSVIRKADSNIPIVVMGADDSAGRFAIRVGAQDFLAKQYLAEHQLCSSLKFAIERQQKLNEAKERDSKLAQAQAHLAEVVSNIKALLEP